MISGLWCPERFGNLCSQCKGFADKHRHSAQDSISAFYLAVFPAGASDTRFWSTTRPRAAAERGSFPTNSASTLQLL